MKKKTPGFAAELIKAKLAARRIYGKYKTRSYTNYGVEYWVVAPGVKHSDGILWIVFYEEPTYMQYYEVMKLHRYTSKIVTLASNYNVFQKSMWSDK